MPETKIKARRFMMFNLSTFNCLTPVEDVLYSAWKKAKVEDKNILRDKFDDELDDFKGIREIQSSSIYDKDGEPYAKKVISGFENECVRLSESFVYEDDNPKNIPFIPEVIILDCHHEIILKQIIDNGMLIAKKEYLVYSSSTNQQKKEQVCLMEKEFYNKHKDRLMCGLSIDIINENGGCNTGKYLAYTSLIFSKSVEPTYEIDIDEVLVLPEFETEITGWVNYLSIEENVMEEKKMSVPVNHMDGSGLFLPGLLPCSAQIRGGWIKGCVFPFDFRQFIIEHQNGGKISEGATIKDAWGKDIPIDYIRDKIKLILNTSQLKMWKKYKSWENYKEEFKKNNLKICINNTMHYPTEDDPMVQASYQFEQTIPRKNVTDEKIAVLSELTIHLINDARTNPDTALKIMGVDLEANKELDPFHASIKAYPKMLQDDYVKKRIGSKIESIRKTAMGGKPFIRGFYSYICPDLYAACEYWFCGDKNPKGLIPAYSVYNSFYNGKDGIEEVACLRSPHLSDCEHGIRKLEKSDKCKKWFPGMDTVISTHDLLTKTLQCDVDGDECLCTHDRAFIDLLDRSKLPLYYEMKKGLDIEVNNENIFKCLCKSFENSIIGDISNSLTKHLNKMDEPDLRFVRFMTAYNNFVIDYPKSQYMPVLPEEYQTRFTTLKDDLSPYFFKYAKDKKEKWCEVYQTDEKSTINRISKYIQNKTRYNSNNIWKESKKKNGMEVDKFNPEYFQTTIPEFQVDRSSDKYKALHRKILELKLHDNKEFREEINKKYGENRFKKSLGYDVYYHYCNREIMRIIGKRIEAAAYLLDIEYFQEKNTNTNKNILWNCFGDILYANLLKKLELPEGSVKVKKLAYQTRDKRELEIEEEVEKAVKESKRNKEVNIYQNEYDWFRNLKCRKGCEHDRYLLYLLIVLFKRKLSFIGSLNNDEYKKITNDTKSYVRIYKHTKNEKRVNRACIDKWIEKCITEKGIKRLEKAGIIRIEVCDRYDKIYIKPPTFNIDVEYKDENPLFTVGQWNPMFDYYKYTGECKVAECEICGRQFRVIGNAKTCGPVHSRMLVLRNKNVSS